MATNRDTRGVMGTVLTLHQGGVDAGELRRAYIEAAAALDNLSGALKSDDVLLDAVGALARRFEARARKVVRDGA